MIQFFMLKLHVGGGTAARLQPSKFELRIAEEGRMYKIWDLVYKIVQNKYKIMIYFSLSKSVWGGGWLGGDVHLIFESIFQIFLKM